MRLDSREKYDRIRRFISDLKAREEAAPFISTDEIPKFGVYDFAFITKQPQNLIKI